MSEEVKDSGIKLFGKTIALLSNRAGTVPCQHTKEALDCETSADSTAPSDEPTAEEEQSDTGGCREKIARKKADRILPCPRCNSAETKFCYYNNYKVNQPRHFCKNCQRYWTSGGAMRNVPVGSGRRKNKHPTIPDYGHIIEAIHRAVRLSPNEFLAFGAVPATPVLPTDTSTLGKHPRESKTRKTTDFSSKPRGGGESLSIPKTLRIHDPSEAAKSSIWSTLGIDHKKMGYGLKAFDGGSHCSIEIAAMILQANPAALSRSLNFRENA